MFVFLRHHYEGNVLSLPVSDEFGRGYWVLLINIIFVLCRKAIPRKQQWHYIHTIETTDFHFWYI